MKKYINVLFLSAIVMFVTSCTKNDSFEKTQMNIKSVLENTTTKVSDSGFENSDQIGVYVVDYSGTTPGSLSPTSNHGTNVKHTYVSASDSWTPEAGKEIYWNDAVTKVDVYGYYPYNYLTLITGTDYLFSVQRDQSTAEKYFKSDFLWAKTANVTSQTFPITLSFGHKMSKIVITTTAGDGFSESEFNAAIKSIQIQNVKGSSNFNLSNGTASEDLVTTSISTITPFSNENVFSAIIPPQKISETSIFLKITVNGVDYFFNKGFTFESGKQYNFYVSINKNSLSVLANSVSDWSPDVNIYPTPECLGITDVQGYYSYRTVKIGTQTWMADNLKTSVYNNGDMIARTIPANLNISSETNPKYQWNTNGYATTVHPYGKLYTWYVVTDPRGICPTGWHIPSDSEWSTLTTYLGGGSIAGNKLREIGTSHWNFSTGANNSSGFTALPGGARFPTGSFDTTSGYWWSSSDYGNVTNAYGRLMYDGVPEDKNELYGLSRDKKYGMSVRCVKD